MGGASVLQGASRIVMVAHYDLDGLASAALLARWARRHGIGFTVAACGARGLQRCLRRLLGELAKPPRPVLVVADITPSPEALGLLAAVSRHVEAVVWVDHHVWPPGLEERLWSLGAHVLHDRGDVAAALVCRLLDCWSDVVSRELVDLARRDDNCSEDPTGLSDRWRLVLRYLHPREASRVVEALRRGDLWPGWAREVYEARYQEYVEQLRRTRVHVYTVEGVRVAVLVPPPIVAACDIKKAGLEPEDADAVAILYPGGVSLKTRRVDASCVARVLGGGGHEHTAGAPRRTLQPPDHVAREVAYAVKKCL